MKKSGDIILSGKIYRYMGMDLLTDDLLENSPKHIVMHSGGADSTLILLGLCELKKKGILKGDIQVVHCVGLCTKGKDLAEERALKKITKYIKSEFDIDLQKIKIEVSNYYDKDEVDVEIGYILQYIYLINAYHLFSNNSCVYMGSIGDDPSEIKLPYIKNILDNLSQIRSNSVHLITPLFNIDKEYILENFLVNYPEVMNMVVTCEFPKIGKNNHVYPCNTCFKCMETKQALSNIINRKIIEKATIKDMIKLAKTRIDDAKKEVVKDTLEV